MSDATAGQWGLPEATHPPAISLHDAWPWMLFGLALLLLIYIVGMDQGALTMIPGFKVHEWVHDGRHLLGFPCH
jgi:hypothetical protein